MPGIANGLATCIKIDREAQSERGIAPLVLRVTCDGNRPQLTSDEEVVVFQQAVDAEKVRASKPVPGRGLRDEDSGGAVGFASKVARFSSRDRK